MAETPPISNFQPVRLSLDFDSEDKIIFGKSCARILGGMAKLKSFYQIHIFDESGNFKLPNICAPTIGFFSQNFFLDYDFDQQDALAGVSAKFKNFLFSYKHSVKAGKGCLSTTAWMPTNPNYSLDIVADLATNKWIPFSSLNAVDMSEPTYDIRTSVDFPLGRVFHSTSDRNESDDDFDVVRGFGAMLEKNFGEFSKGKAEFNQSRRNVILKYNYKDEQLTFIPSLTLPSKRFIVALKRSFEDGHKLSILYSPKEAAWETVYKFKPEHKKFKIKTGFNSNAATSFVSLWVGDESEGAKKGPLKMKGQIMLQFNHDTREPIFMYRVKKRWDFL